MGGLTQWGTFVCIMFSFIGLFILLVASSMTTLSIHIKGLLRPIMTLANQDTVIDLSLFGFLSDTFKETEGAGPIVFGIVIIITTLFVPLLQIFVIALIPFRKFTLHQAKKFLSFNQV